MIKKIFWNGLKAFLPIALTLGIVIWLLNLLETFFGRVLRHIIPTQYYFTGLGILVGILFIFVVGILVNAWVINNLYKLADKIVKRIPFIKTIYNSIQDLLNFFHQSQESSQQQSVVMVQTPMGKVIGFVTRETLTDLPLATENAQDVLVYVPLSYTIGGLIMVVSKDLVTPLNWPAEQVMSFILTAGMAGQKTED